MTFTTYFPIICATIENPVLGRLQQVRNAVCLLHATRSPAAYQADIGMEPFMQSDLNRFPCAARPNGWCEMRTR